MGAGAKGLGVGRALALEDGLDPAMLGARGSGGASLAGRSVDPSPD